MKYVAILNGKKYEVEIEKINEYVPLSREAAVAPVDQSAPIAAVKQTPVKTAPAPVVAAAPAVKPQTSVGQNEVLSPMPGNIWEVKVAPGDTVKEGQVMIILEAMKMENEIVAPADGTVASVLVKKGDAVDSDAVLAVLK